MKMRRRTRARQQQRLAACNCCCHEARDEAAGEGYPAPHLQAHALQRGEGAPLQPLHRVAGQHDASAAGGGGGRVQGACSAGRHSSSSSLQQTTQMPSPTACSLAPAMAAQPPAHQFLSDPPKSLSPHTPTPSGTHLSASEAASPGLMGTMSMLASRAQRRFSSSRARVPHSTSRASCEECRRRALTCRGSGVGWDGGAGWGVDAHVLAGPARADRAHAMHGTGRTRRAAPGRQCLRSRAPGAAHLRAARDPQLLQALHFAHSIRQRGPAEKATAKCWADGQQLAGIHLPACPPRSAALHPCMHGRTRDPP